MKLLEPLGFLALFSLVVLIIIYIIKPLYQTKKISSTFIWKESLKYQKRDLPNSVFNNLIIFILQILILFLITFIIVSPFFSKKTKHSNCNVIIIDGSASMLFEVGGITRFDRASEKIIKQAKEAREKKTVTTIILALSSPKLIVENENDIDKITSALIKNKPFHGSANIKDAFEYSLQKSKDYKVFDLFLYTGKNYKSTGDINIINVSDENEWNAAILGFASELVDGSYKFTVETAIYKAYKYLNVSLEVSGVNNTSDNKKATKRLNYLDYSKRKVIFEDLNIFNFTKIKVEIKTDDNEKDSFIHDDQFFYFENKNEKLKIEYASTKANNFFLGSLQTFKQILNHQFDINITESNKIKDVKTSGFDFYIFEHFVPEIIPNDGIVWLVNPNENISDIKVGDKRYGDFKVKVESAHLITKNLTSEKIGLSSYRPLTFNSDYHLLFFVDGDPVFILKDNKETKLAVLSLNLNESNLPLIKEFPILMYNFFDTFFPKIVKKNVYEVGENIEFKMRGTNVKILGPGIDETMQENKNIKFTNSGVYSIKQTLLSKEVVESMIFLKIPISESDIVKLENSDLLNSFTKKAFNGYFSILLYLVITLLVLVILERFLYYYKNI